MKKTLKFCLTFIIIFICSSTIKALSNGTYIIESALSENFVVDVKSANTKNSTNIQLYSDNNSMAQRWKVQQLSKDTYRITSVLDNNKVMDVSGAKKTSGTNVQLYQYNSTLAQQWTLKDAGGGYYYIVSKCNGLYLDVQGAGIKNGTNIQMYKGNGTKAQKFKFIEVLSGDNILPDGDYVISTSLADKQVLDVSSGNFANFSNIQIYGYNNSWAQIWHIKYLNNGYYEISLKIEDNMVLDVAGGKTSSGTNVHLYKSNGSDAQQWMLKDAGGGYYYLISKLGHYNLFMDLSSANYNNKSNIQVFGTNGSNAQKFKFTKTKASPIKNGLYTISSSTNDTKNIALSGDRLVNGSNIQLEDKSDTNGQKWNIKYIGNGYYSIMSAFNNDFVLDVDGGKAVSGTNVQLYKSNGSNAQQWYIKYIDGKYVISPKINSLTLDLNDSSVDIGTNIEVRTYTGEESQQFILTPTEKNNNIPNYDNANYPSGYYTISSLLAPQMVLDVSGGYKLNGTNIQLYNSNSTLAQIWYVQKLTNGYYSITSSMNRRTSLDVANNGKTPGTNIQLYKANGSDAQQWLLKDLGDGYVSIISKTNGLAIDLADVNIKNGTNILMNTITYSNSEKFKLTSYTKQKIYNGIDVSKWQGDINWENVAKTNIGFVIIRAGFGDNRVEYDDKKFATYVAACEKYNIPYGIYLYSYATDTGNTITGAGNEADHALRLIDFIGADNYSPNLGTKVFLDMEDDSTKGVGKNTLTNIADTFCSKIERNGYSCGIYANKDWFTNYLNSSTLNKKYDIWLAEWINKNTLVDFNKARASKPTYNLTSYKYWQFTSKGSLNGILGNVDLDLGYDIFD